MVNDAISLLSIVWTSLNTWLTPTILFLLLNLMIGTIFITSAFTSSKPQLHQNHLNTVFHHQHQHQQHQYEITRAPSILERLKSINFYSNCSHPHLDQPTQPQNVALQQQFQNLPSQHDHFPEPAYELSAGKFSGAEAETQTQTQIQTRTPPIEEDMLLLDNEAPTLEEIYNKIKSTSSIQYNRQNSDTRPVGGEIPVRLPAKIKKSASHKSAFNHFKTLCKPENVATTTETGGGTEVDAKADDFINRFKKQLQLQRIESILRYKEMITKSRG